MADDLTDEEQDWDARFEKNTAIATDLLKTQRDDITRRYPDEHWQTQEARIIRQALHSVLTSVLMVMGDLRRLTAKVDSHGSFEYRGVHQEGAIYRKGDFVTHNGSLWHANRPTVETPGEGNSTRDDWQLAVRKGKDGKR
jgi:hypothetical protein